MEKRYSESFTLRTCHCDLHGQWRLGAILESMQETASAHCARLGLGREVMDGLGLAWVLSRAEVRLARAAHLGETVTVETWPLPPKHLFYPRINALWDGEGRQIGEASSLWVLLDVNTRRIVSSDAVLARLPDNRDMPGFMPAPPRPLDAPPREATFLPGYCDFDVNGHVNNTRYLDWTCDALGIPALNRAWVKSFCVSYDQELLPGTEVRAALSQKEDRFSYAGYAGEKRCFLVSGCLETLI